MSHKFSFLPTLPYERNHQELKHEWNLAGGDRKQSVLSFTNIKNTTEKRRLPADAMSVQTKQSKSNYVVPNKTTATVSLSFTEESKLVLPSKY